MILSRLVHEFKVSADEESKTVTYRLTLAERGTRKASGRLINERYQVSYSLLAQSALRVQK